MKYLSQRNAFLVHEISGVIFSSTDAFVLSTFCSLIIASIYSVYNLIYSSLNSLINAVNNGLHFILGQTYAEDREKYTAVHDAYDSLYMAMVFSFMTVAYLLTSPFINLYTAGIEDANYLVKGLPLLFTLVQLLSCSRAVSSRLINVAGHAKATQNRSILEAVLNLGVSITLVNFIGIYGVLVGTIVALLYRTNDIIIYANKKILKRSPWVTYKKMIVNFVVYFAIVLADTFYLSQLIMSYCDSYFDFIIIAIPTTLLSCITYGVIACLLNHGMVVFLKQNLFKRRKRIR